jgi:hypothetical protein
VFSALNSDHSRQPPDSSQGLCQSREVAPPIEVETATWSQAGQLDWWVKERHEWWGVVANSRAARDITQDSLGNGWIKIIIHVLLRYEEGETNDQQ